MENELIKILYIDDEKAALFNFEQLFHDDFEIYTAISAAQGMEILDKTDIQIIVSDQRMPDKTGIQFFAEVAQLYPNTIRILLTAYSEAEVIIDAINRGQVYQYITKPFETGNLKNILDKASQNWRLKKESDALIAQLQESEVRFRNFFANAPVGINGFDSEGKVISVNRVARQYFGVSQDDPLNNYRLFEDPSISDETKWKIKHGQVATEERYIDFRIIQQHGMYETSKTEEDKICIKLTYTPYGADMIRPDGFIIIIQDITERKRGEEALEYSRNRLEEAQRIARIGNWEANIATGELYWSKVIFDTFGFDYKNFKPSVEAFYNAVHPDDKGLVIESEKRSEQTGFHDVVHRIIRSNGEVRFVHELAKRYTNNKGELILLRGTVQDITERRQAEEALKESEAVYRTLVERLPDGVYKSTHDGKFVDVNPAMVRMLGYTSKEELLAVDIKTQLYFEPGDRDSLALEEELKEIGIFQLKKKDGSGIWVEDHGWYDLDENGEILFHQGISRDITVRRKAELERQVIYEISQGVTTTDNLSELLKLIHQSLGKVLYADNCFVALYDQNTGLFSFPYYTDQFDTIPEPVEMPKSCTAYVFRTGQPLLITPEVFKQLKEQNEVELVGSPSPSWIGVPLKTPAGKIGVLVLQHYQKENVYSEQDIQFLDSVGSQIAMAIERRQAEEELRESEIELKVILQSTADGILAIDGNGKMIKTNRRFAELWRIPQDLIDLGDDDSLLNFVLDQLSNPEEFISKVQKLYHSTVEDLDHLQFKDGRIFERFSAPLFMPDSSIGRVWSFRDITIRKQAEESLKESEKKFRLLIENQGEGLTLVDPDENLIFVNPAAESIFGVEPGMLVGQNLKQFIVTDQFDQLRKETGKREKNEKSSYEVDIVTPSGIRKNILVRATPQNDENGKYIYTFGVIRDITERKKAEKEILEANKQLLNINSEKDKFFSIIAHDLKGPFNGFLGLTRIMAEELPSLTMAQVQEIAVRMSKSANNLYRLLENLLEWSQIQQGTINFNPEIIQLGLVIGECIETIKDSTKNKEIEIVTDTPEGITAFADRNMLQAIIRNLVTNAVKFTPKGGKVYISAKSFSDNRVEISIRDSGIGMSQSLVENLFRIDVQTNRKGTDGEPSTGLGLLLCKEFVEKHGGKLRVESEVGKGSSFYFTLAQGA